MRKERSEIFLTLMFIMLIVPFHALIDLQVTKDDFNMSQGFTSVKPLRKEICEDDTPIEIFRQSSNLISNHYYPDSISSPLLQPLTSISRIADYTPHASINIDDNSDFLALGFPGYGNKTHPYLIDGYNITGIGTEKLISINNTDVYFQVSNCLLANGYVIIEFNGVQNAFVCNNSIIEGYYAGIMIQSCSSLNITNNSLAQNGGYDYFKCSGFLLSASSNILCRNNTFRNHPKSGIYTSYGVVDCIFENNTFLDGEYGLYLGSGWTGSGPNTYRLTVTDNYLENNNYGIRISEAGNGTYERNTILQSTTCGFYLWHTSHNLFIENTISSCGDGIQFNAITVDFIKNNTWIKNRIQDSQNYGIRINGANGTVFRNNSIVTSSSYGISLQVNCLNAFFENNIILDNYLSGGISFGQAFDSGTANGFSHNHWNDWTAPDSNNDGYVDNPYTIDGTAFNSDPFPRTHPYLFHDPIFVLGDAGFLTEGFSGTGTKTDPYVLKGYSFINSTQTLIEIQSTTAYFEIKDCFFNANNSGQYGIYLNNVDNGTIFGNTFHNCKHGVWLAYSSKNNISSNTVYNSSHTAILLYSSNHNTLSSNKVYNSGPGVSLSESSNNLISSNKIYNNSGDGISLSSSSNNNTISDNVINHNSVKGIDIRISSNSTISNNTIYNNSDEGIYLGSSSNNTIEINGIYNNSDEGIYLYSSYNNSIFNNTIWNNSYQGIYVGTSENNTFSSNTVYNNDHSGIDLGSSSNNTLFNNTIYNNSLEGIYLGSSSNNTLFNNTIYSNSHDGIYLWSSSNNTISSNTIYNNTYGGIRLSNSNKTSIIKNIISNNSWDGIRLASSCKNSVSNNTVHNSSRGIRLEWAFNNSIFDNYCNENPVDGISVSFSWNNSIYYNIFYHNHRNGIQIETSSDYNCIFDNTVYNNTNEGVHIHDSNYNTISDNVIYDNSWNGIKTDNSYKNSFINNTLYSNSYGIHLSSSSNNSIINNTIDNNRERGISLESYSINNSVYGNTISNHEYRAITIVNSKNNNIVFNQISTSTQYGISIESSAAENNIIAWNDFFDNGGGPSQARDDGIRNIFAYNYWNEWTAPDTNSDGIVDNPYVIDGAVRNNRDPAPLASPAPSSPFHYLSEPTVIEPNFSGTFSGMITITWHPAIDSLAHSITYTVYLSANGGTSWLSLGTVTTPTLLFDTTTVADGSNYLVKVIATCSESLTNEDTSDEPFTIQNEVITTTTTTIFPTTAPITTTAPAITTTTTTSTAPTISAGSAPGWLFAILLLVAISILKTRRSFKKRV